MADYTIVTMTVDTENIRQNSVNNYVDFVDDQGNRMIPGHPEDFMSIVNESSYVQWMGTPETFGGPEITITQIDKKDSTEPNIMDLNSLAYSGGNARASIVSVPVSPTEHENYSITFKFMKEGVEEEFTVDPKLRMRGTHSYFVVKVEQFVEIFKSVARFLFVWEKKSF